jgi:metallo-beta-lactamase family protein
MELEFYGATGGVTGSCHIIRNSQHQILIDCGLIQGRRKEEEANRDPFPFNVDALDAVVLSHAHIDHSGRTPLLVKRGFRGPIYTQNATRDLCAVLLRDSASLAERDAKYENKKRAKKGMEPVEPLYTEADAIKAWDHMEGMPYREKREILPGISIRYQDAGHILGACMVEIWLSEGSVTRKIVFSGDIGQYDTPILNDPTTIEEADLVLMESTYGNRLHRDRQHTIEEIGEVISRAGHEHGNILIPAFSIGRSQELLYLMGMHYDEWELDRWQIFLDSPMAIEASHIYWDYPHLYDEEATRLRSNINEMPHLRNLKLTHAVEESMQINEIRSGAIIIAGSGMCNGGRIVHHLKHNITRKECHVMIVGYQANGTLGRRLVNGEDEIKIHGNFYKVNAQIHTVGGLSAHADQHDLLRWVSGFNNKPKVFVVHGEPEVKQEFSQLLQEKLQLKATVPKAGDIVDLSQI